MEFELLDHPADIGFRVRGASLPDLFANSAHALVFILLDPSHIARNKKFISRQRAAITNRFS